MVSRLLFLLGLSVFLHLLVVTGLFLYPHDLMNQSQAPLIVELAPLPQVPKKPSNIDAKEKRIVQTDVAEKVKDAAKEAFLGAQTQRADRQTVSSQRMQEKTTASSTRKPKASAASNPLSGAKSLAILGVPYKLSEKKRETPNEIDRGDQTLPARVNRSAQEYLRGFKESDRTLLNTKEYVFFSYFQRIRQRLDTAWQPLLRNHITKLYKRGRQLASEVDHKTQLLVVLNKKGEIEKVQMIEESGVSDLDQAAVEAFNQAGPFPNPPRGLVDGGGHVEIRWDFVLKT